MDAQRFRRLVGLAAFGLILMIAGCTPRSYLIVDYQVPPDSNALPGQRLRLQIVDKRSDAYVLAPSAARQFEGFKDRYSLAWVTSKGRILAGEYDLQPMLYRAFEKRLMAMGAMVVADGGADLPLMQVELLSLNVQEQGRKWEAQLSLSAVVSKANGPVARETLKGSAERVKVIGRKGADNVLSDIVSDMINRLNVENLFSQARLL